MSTRREFLVGAGAKAAGLAALTGAGLVFGVEEHAARATADREGAGVAATSGPPARLGVRRVVWSTDPVGPFAAITFDDGPTPQYTPRILAALADAGLRATFNVMGHNAMAHPGLVREIVAAGHEIGNHTMTHLDLAQITAPRIREEIVRCTDVVEQLIQQPLVGFRPPRGQLSGYAMMVAAELGYDVFLWSCTRGPRGASTAAAVARSMGTTVQAGDVLDLHDGIGRGTFEPASRFAKGLAARREVEVQALPEALRRIADRGVVLTSATDLLARSRPEPLPTWQQPSPTA